VKMEDNQDSGCNRFQEGCTTLGKREGSFPKGGEASALFGLLTKVKNRKYSREREFGGTSHKRREMSEK